MIVFQRLWRTMAKKQVTTYLLREQYGIESRTVRRLRANQNVTTETLNRLCRILDCQLEDIAEYIPDESSSPRKTSKI